MRPRVALISALACALAACGGTAPPRLGYAPPAEQPAQPGAGYVGQPAADLIWHQLLDRLNQSDLQVDLADRARGVMVARYSGDPSPYVTCGWILLYGGGEPEQIDASTDASFDRVVRGRSFGIGRDLKLDARLVVEIRPEGDHALVEATSNYVLTKTVSAEARSGWRQARTHEIVSFSTGERGEFSKGTVCQPNGALERTVLDILPPATRVAQRAQPAVPRTQRATIVETELASDEIPGQAPAGDDLQEQVPAIDDLAQQALAIDDLPQQAPASGDLAQQQARALDDLQRQAAACTIADKTFCEVLEITDPYRRANEERGLGLELNHLEGGNPLVAGSDLGLDIGLPSYDAYLAVSYFLRDGTVHHVLSGSNRRWPANAREFVGASGLAADQSGSVEMVVAVASDVPLFTSPRPPSEAAESYLADLRARFAEMTNGNARAQIAASLVVITPTRRQPS
ncbi:MAG: hypothetical protein ACREIR_03815 [Geminicoccaceae bacterium]